MAWYDAVGAFGSLAAGLGAAGQAFGLGSSGDGRGASKRAIKQNTRIQQEQWALQQRAYKRGLQDRVQDAAAAGLHPLFALGYQTPSIGSVGGMAGDFSSGGRAEDWAQFGAGLHHLSRAGRQATGIRTRYDRARLRLAEAEADLAESQAARAKQAVNYTRPPMDPEGFVAAPGKTYPLADYTKVTPVPIPARAAKDTSRTAGVKPAWQLVEASPGGKYYYVPQSDEGVAEALEGWGLPLAIWKNLSEEVRYRYRRIRGGNYLD